jgi:hypothetical protein
MSVVLIVAATPLVLGASPAAADCGKLSRPRAHEASLLAKQCRKPVRVTEEQTSTTDVQANVDGSFTTTEWAVPHQALRADGTWVAVDTTLRFNGDGSVSPVAAPAKVTLSGGGTGPLARQYSGSKQLAWSWLAGPLPRPTLSRNVATYADVLPAVDLKVTVDEFGFSEVLVVKTREAALLPQLAQIGFGLSGSGLSAEGLAGTAGSVDRALTADFAVGGAYMWDSSLPTKKMPASAPAVDVRDATTSDVGGPSAGAVTSVVPTRMSGTTLVLTPNQTMLTSPKTRLPIFIDPKQSSPARSSWTMINSGHTSQSYWSYDRAEHAKVGNAGDGVNMYRSLFQFSTSTWRNKHVIGVIFSADLVHSWSCSNTTTQLRISSQTIGSSTTWSSNNASWGSSLATASNQNCNDASGVHTEFSAAALTSAVDAAKANASITIGLRASDETAAANGWKKFDETSGSGGAHLSVTYNTAPSLSNLLIDGKACGTSSSPTLVATVGSPPHNPVPQVTIADNEDASSTVTFTYPASGGGTTTKVYGSLTIPTTKKFDTGIPAANIPAGTTFSWKVTVSDGTDSTTSANCYFKVDNTVPPPPVVASADGRYPDDGAIHDGVGKPGSFTITGSPGIVKYVWSAGPGSPITTVTTTNGAPVTVSATPAELGLNTVQATGYTAAGVASITGVAEYLAGGGASPVARWSLNGNGTDTGTGNHPLTTTGATWTPDGRLVGESVATLDPATSNVTAANVARTDTSFAVSAWVRPSHITGTSTDGYMTAVAESGATTSAFQLQYRYQDGAAPGSYCFTMRQTDVDPGATLVQACKQIPATCDNATTTKCRWTQLVGTYDASLKKIQLYVDGTLAQETAYTATWNATGAVVVGARQNSGGLHDKWRGDISDVRVWDRVAYKADVDALRSVARVGEWDFDNYNGDDALVLHPLTFVNGTPAQSFNQAFGSPALLFDSTQYARTSGPVVRTDNSFTVAAWVSPTVVSTTTTNGYMTAVTQDGTQTSGLQLQYRSDVGTPDKQEWCFTGRSTDVSSSSTNPPPPSLTLACWQDVSGTTLNNPYPGLWTHLVGVYDAFAGTMTLYVDGIARASVAYTATWNAAGPVTVGARKDASIYMDNFYGGIDNVVIFNGVLNDGQVSNLYFHGDAFQ